MIQRADTVGVFQIESRAQMSMLPRLKPRTYYDLVIQIAIVLPRSNSGRYGAPFLKRSNGIEKPSFPSQEVKRSFRTDNGRSCFSREQVIKIAMVAAGFQWRPETDQLRRAISSWKRVVSWINSDLN